MFYRWGAWHHVNGMGPWMMNDVSIKEREGNTVNDEFDCAGEKGKLVN